MLGFKGGMSRVVGVGAVVMIGMLGLMSPAAATAGKSVQLHVAPGGNDAGPGTAKRPFATLHRARDAVRVRSAGMDSSIFVNLHAGKHVLGQPLRLRGDMGDSGRNGHRVIYQAFGYQTKRLRRALAKSKQRRQRLHRKASRTQERPDRVRLRRAKQRVRDVRKQLAAAKKATRDNVVVSGGREITGWQLDDEEDNVWSAEVGGLEFRQLYVDGERATRARLNGGARSGIPGDVVDDDDGYITDSVEPQSWERPEDIEFVHHPPSDWHHFSEPRCGVAAITGDAESTTIVMDQPCHRWYRQNHEGEWEGFTNFFPAPPTHIENSRSFLTEPGTFYLDRSRAGDHVLFYIPRPGEDLDQAEVVAPSLEKLVDGSGDSESPLQDVTFRGITFAHATWTGPSEPTGFSQVFGPLYEGGDTPHFDDPWDMSDDAKAVPGNVRFQHSRRIALTDNRFTQLGADAVELSRGTSESTVRGNIVTDVSGGGIAVGTRYPGTNLDRINPDNTVANNWIHDVGIEYQGSVGIYAEKTQRAKILHNQINDIAYSGLAFGEFWTHYPAGKTTAHGNRILNNRIFDAVRKQLDGGAIWTAAHQGTSYENGTVVSGNVAHDVGPPEDLYEPAPTPDWGGLGLFPDDDSSFIRWTDNVVYRTGRAAIGGCQPLGHLTFEQNYLDNDEPAWDCFGPVDDVVVQGNILLEGEPGEVCQEINGCAAIAENAGLEPGYRHLLSE